jgi:hypothetical protein
MSFVFAAYPFPGTAQNRKPQSGSLSSNAKIVRNEKNVYQWLHFQDFKYKAVFHNAIYNFA